MALVECPGCNNKVSDRAEACPQCGYPIAELLRVEARGAAENNDLSAHDSDAPQERSKDSDTSTSPQTSTRPFFKMLGYILLAIVGLWLFLALIVGPAVIDNFTRGQFEAAEVQIKQFMQAVRLFEHFCNRVPTPEEGLDALVQPVSSCPNWKRTIDSDLIPSDPWGQPYHYVAPARDGSASYEIYSDGLTEDASDDVSSSNIVLGDTPGEAKR